MQRYTYLRLFELDQLSSIFVKELDAEVFLTIIDTFLDIVICNDSFNNEVEQDYIGRLLLVIATKTPKFDFTIEFLEDKDREKIGKVVKGLDKIPDDLSGQLLKCYEGF